jgi:DNA-binding NtrC family response regulator
MAKILIIDDDSDFRRMLNRMLKQADYEVVEASNGEEGLKFYQKDQIDLVITDIFMPKKEGIQTLIELKGINPDIKIIAVSGGGSDIKLDYLMQMKDLGAHITLEKPFGSEELFSAIRELLETE